MCMLTQITVSCVYLNVFIGYIVVSIEKKQWMNSKRMNAYKYNDE